MSRVFWDTNIFIYFFEGHETLGPMTRTLRSRMMERGDQLLTSAMTLGEILFKPVQQADAALTARYEDALRTAAMILPFDVEAAKHYARLRQDRTLKPPDAIQLACAANAQVDLFITNDNRLQNLQVPGIQFIVAVDRVPI